MRLKDRVAVVTGGAQGLGRAYGQALAAEGAIVVLADIDGELATRSAELMSSRTIGCEVDVASESSVENLFADVESRFGRLDVLVNNAGGVIYPPQKLADTSFATWNATLALNAGGCFLCCRAALRAMRRQRSGKIINVASASVVNGLSAPMYFPDEQSNCLVPYIASKGAIVGLTRALAREVGSDGICVNAIGPGLTLTDKMKEKFPTSVTDVLAAQQALPRPGQPADIVGTVLFLASDESNFMTGQFLCIDGGWTTH